MSLSHYFLNSSSSWYWTLSTNLRSPQQVEEGCLAFFGCYGSTRTKGKFKERVPSSGNIRSRFLPPSLAFTPFLRSTIMSWTEFYCLAEISVCSTGLILYGNFKKWSLNREWNTLISSNKIQSTRKFWILKCICSPYHNVVPKILHLATCVL